MSEREANSISVAVFTASCSGCHELSRSIGLPVASVHAARDVDAALEAMNKDVHAGWVLWPDSFQPFEPQDGWDDWHLLPLDVDAKLPVDMRFDAGRYCVDLPDFVSPDGFETALHIELRRFRVDDVTTSASWLIARSDHGQSFLTLPRFTLNNPENFRAGAKRADDLFVLDPSCHPGFIALIVQRAKANAVRIAEEAMRNASS